MVEVDHKVWNSSTVLEPDSAMLSPKSCFLRRKKKKFFKEVEIQFAKAINYNLHGHFILCSVENESRSFENTLFKSNCKLLYLH